MTRIYRYILSGDNGMAPCAQDGLISLGTCKPQIRQRARKGDWVAGFMPGTMRLGQLVWAGKVTETLDHEAYRKRFPERRDAIYGLASDREYKSHLPGYHCDPAQQRRDSTNPVLLFDKACSRYLGDRPEQLQDKLMHLAAQDRVYRVNFRRDGDLQIWEDWLDNLHLGKGKGEPREILSLCSGCLHCSGNRGSGPSCGRPTKRHRKKPRNC